LVGVEVLEGTLQLGVTVLHGEDVSVVETHLFLKGVPPN
jgi:hypothetical protein